MADPYARNFYEAVLQPYMDQIDREIEALVAMLNSKPPRDLAHQQIPEKGTE